jgi:aminoglycoside phosphotransferase (APT) family kinase protein
MLPTIAHGDFTPWNVFATDSAEVALVDYERVGWRAPFTDVWHLAVQQQALTGRVKLPWHLVNLVARHANESVHDALALYAAYLVEELRQDLRDWVVAGRRHPQLRRLIAAKTDALRAAVRELRSE